jgi:hypothetical protein
MSEIDAYLEQLRSRLEVAPTRAEEIVAEVRSHLEARAAQLRTSGMGDNEAAAEAVRNFGEPGHVAQDLLRANSRHRRQSMLRAIGAMAISLGAGFALAAVYGGPESRNSLSVSIIMSITGLGWNDAGWVFMVIALLPSALLTGIVGGRRFYWLASSPALFWMGLCWIMSLITLRLQPEAKLGEQLIYTLAIPGLAALVFVGIGRVGVRLSTIRSMEYGLGGVCGSYVLWLWLRAFGVAFESLDGLGITLVIVQPSALIFLAAAHRDGRLSRRAFLAAARGIFAGSLLLIAAWLAVMLSAGVANLGVVDQNRWLAVAVCESIIGLMGLRSYRIHEHRQLVELSRTVDGTA